MAWGRETATDFIASRQSRLCNGCDAYIRWGRARVRAVGEGAFFIIPVDLTTNDRAIRLRRNIVSLLG